MLIIWRTCRIWLRTEWSVQIEHISTSMMYQNGQCIKLTDHERWQLSALDLGASFQMHDFVRVTLHNWQISRQVLYKSADVAQMLIVHREEKLPGSERCHGKFQVFSVWKWWRKCGDALTWWSRHKEAWIFWRRFQSLPHVCVVVGPSPENCSKTPWRMRGSAACSKFQCF